eukprot:NODE_1187_length_651_cov_846.136213_g930_i0.p1 GENE.NODE_1187_length_651_cov_846.136213_g930_i0~~NODE_1187_length_651_cov_846.136213_g930_i0.p1  ORF type:complete len:206 (-),score=56.26 NODE_1187_length_651_cov_846.136213_g930_i0:4-621(-)
MGDLHPQQPARALPASVVSQQGQPSWRQEKDYQDRGKERAVSPQQMSHSFGPLPTAGSSDRLHQGDGVDAHLPNLKIASPRVPVPTMSLPQHSMKAASSEVDRKGRRDRDDDPGMSMHRTDSERDRDRGVDIGGHRGMAEARGEPSVDHPVVVESPSAHAPPPQAMHPMYGKVQQRKVAVSTVLPTLNGEPPRTKKKKKKKKTLR